MREFSQLEQIKEEITKALDSGATPVAAFDADGTLWDTDIGETFFDYQIKNKLVELPSDPWGHYSKLKEQNAESAYLWLAQINKGKNIETVLDWANEAITEIGTLPLFPTQQEIIELLHKNNVEVYIVTASVRWAVMPAAKYYGIKQDNVIGIQTEIENSIITDRQKGSITYKQGKVSGLLENNNNRAPFFASGNTMGDLALLDSATHIRFVNAAVNNDHENFETEQEMAGLAKSRNWYLHNYYG